MNVYVETNFVLELVFVQEQSAYCESLLEQCDGSQHRLVIPAYCLAEPNEKLHRQARNRTDLQRTLESELRLLARSHSYRGRIDNIKDIASLLVKSNEEERRRFDTYRRRLLAMAEIVSLTAEILEQAARYENSHQLAPQDALVYASVMNHLSRSASPQNCFLNRNSRDFDSPDIVDELAQYNCRMIPRFDDGDRYVRSFKSDL